MAISVRRVLAVGAVAAALVLTAACGDLAPAPEGAVPGTADRQHLGRAEFVPAVDKAMAAAGSMHFDLRTSKGGETSRLAGDASMGPTGSIRLTIRDGLGIYGRASTHEHELVLANRRMYVSVPDRPGKFVEYDASDPTTSCGCLAHEIRREVSAVNSLADLQRSMVGLQFVGLEARGGLYLEHYRASVDPARLVGKARARQADVPDAFVYDVWLDSGHLLHQIKGEVLGMQLEGTYSDWGKRVDVLEPGPKDVVNAPRA